MNDRQVKSPWESIGMRKVGSVTKLVLQGGGKGSPSPADPGEPRKVLADPQEPEA